MKTMSYIKGKVIRYVQNETDVTYTIQSGNYKYPCGIQIKNYKSTKYGLVLYEKSRNYSEYIKQSGGNDVTSGNDNADGGRYVNDSDGTISKQSGTGYGKKDDHRVSNTKHSKPNKSSGKEIDETSELDSAIEKQKQFLRGFTKK